MNRHGRKLSKTERFFVAKDDQESFENKFAFRLAQLRIDAGYTQKALCRRLRVGEKLYSSWETGQRIGILHLHYIVRIAKFYRLTVPELFADVPASYVPPARIVERPTRGQQLHSKHIGARTAVNRHSRCVPGSEYICAECAELMSEALEATA